MNPQWLMLPALVAFGASGYYFNHRMSLGIIFLVIGALLLIYKWKLQWWKE